MDISFLGSTLFSFHYVGISDFSFIPVGFLLPSASRPSVLDEQGIKGQAQCAVMT
jgi:hypothetical protein